MQGKTVKGRRGRGGIPGCNPRLKISCLQKRQSLLALAKAGISPALPEDASNPEWGGRQGREPPFCRPSRKGNHPCPTTCFSFFSALQGWEGVRRRRRGSRGDCSQTQQKGRKSWMWNASSLREKPPTHPLIKPPNYPLPRWRHARLTAMPHTWPPHIKLVTLSRRKEARAGHTKPGLEPALATWHLGIPSRLPSSPLPPFCLCCALLATQYTWLSFGGSALPSSAGREGAGLGFQYETVPPILSPPPDRLILPPLSCHTSPPSTQGFVNGRQQEEVCLPSIATGTLACKHTSQRMQQVCFSVAQPLKGLIQDPN